MSDCNMDEDLLSNRLNICEMLTREDLLSAPNITTTGEKTDKDEDACEMLAKATAAFLGPVIWTGEPRIDYLDLDALLGNNSDDGQQILQNSIEQTASKNGSQEQMNVLDVPNMHLTDANSCGEATLSEPPSPKTPPQGNFCKDENEKVLAVDCNFSVTDIALATPPGHKHYDPASTHFPDEELKPQPIIKKSRKTFVPDNLKDDRYWARRHKNNIAAKRSREARRLKENQIVLRASYLEKENNSLKDDVTRLRAENVMLKNQLKKFQQ